MKTFRSLMLSIGVLTLAGCQTFDGVVKDFQSIKLPSLNAAGTTTSENLIYSGDCPAVDVVEELSSLTEFSGEPSESNLISAVDITNFQTACEYDERSVTVDLKMSFDGRLGPQGRVSSNDKPFFSYPFFVAVTNASGKILAKEVFAASMTYNPGQTAQVYNENMRQIIPIEHRDNGANYKILVGFQLTPDQLAHNRAVIRARAQEQATLAAAQSQSASAQQQIVIEPAPGQPSNITKQPGQLPPGKVGAPVDIINSY